jgi:hypothetical protein
MAQSSAERKAHDQTLPLASLQKRKWDVQTPLF